MISIPALTALKLLAWHERGLEEEKDARDFYFLLRNYYRAGNENRLYEEAQTVLESAGFDVELAGATLLGYDTNVILEMSTREALFRILEEPNNRDRLVIHMDRSFNADSAVTLRYLEQFERGLSLD